MSGSAAPTGSGTATTLSSTEIFGNGQGAPLVAARAHHTVTALPNGELVVIGGEDGKSVLASIEVYGAPTTPSPTGAAPVSSGTGHGNGNGNGNSQGNGNGNGQGHGNGNGNSQGKGSPGTTPAPTTTTTTTAPAAGAPSIDQVSPPQAAPGDSIELKGTGFDPDPTKDTVTIGGVAAPVTAAQNNPNHDRLTVVVPASLKSGPSYTITVTVAGKASNTYAFSVR